MLKKSLYGLKQAPRKWYLKFDRFMTEQGYSRCHSDHCVYFKRLDNDNYIILLLYVDDMLVSGSNMQDINVLKIKLANSFVMKDLGATKKILCMRIIRDRKNYKLTLSRVNYMSKVSYSSVVGSLMYAMVCTRMDIAYAVGVVSRFMNNLGKEHWEAVKWILRYLRGTTAQALCFGGSNTIL
eukprot:Gb_02705 [translate_table: standard]